jgi:hypothetical protein
MRRAGGHFAMAVVLTVTAGCTPNGGPGPNVAVGFTYLGVQTRLLDDELVGFLVEMYGPSQSSDIADYAECAAAQYALIRGYGFARHVRTNVQEEAGVWRGDAVYTISPALPRGVQTIDAEVVVADCAEQGIPTV